MYPSGEVTFRVVWKKKSYDVTFPIDEKAIRLKEHIETLTGNFCDWCACLDTRLCYTTEKWH